MAIDYDILAECGTTKERLKQLFTAKMPTPQKEAKLKATKEGKEELKRITADVKKRQELEEQIGSWLHENIYYSLENHAMHSAVDMAWDSAPINKYNLPLMQFAQGRIDVSAVETALKDVPNGDKFVKKNDLGGVVGIDLPRFCEMNINIVRSVITRRVAAQSVKYELWPWFKYEPRDGTQVGRLRADMTSQRMDIMADQYGYAAFQEQVCRDMLLYPNGGFAFPRCAWERDVQWRKKPTAAEFSTENGKIAKEAVVVREGVAWGNAPSSRVFYDNNYAVSTINTDTGCEYIGFWDVSRWGNIKGNPEYFNHDRVAFSADTAAWFTHYAAYFNQYLDQVTAPNLPQSPGDNNDLKNRLGLYSSTEDNVSCFFTNLWVKIIPKNWNVGSYPYPLWVHLKCAGDNTVVYADIMPSGPGAVFRFNCNDSRLNNISMGHELLQYQDQISNLFSQLLSTIKADLFSVAILNEDVFPATDDGKKVLAEFKKVMGGKSWYADMQLLTCSFDKLSQLIGKEVTADMVFKVVRSTPNTAINEIFKAIASVVAMADKLMVMSAHESGQSAPHEISATESNHMASSTDTIYSYISAALDRGRAAMKRICYESTVACGTDEIVLPVAKRYPVNVVTKAGFTVLDQDDDRDASTGYITVKGAKYGLVHDYIFTSRDGANRASNTAAATALVQLLSSFVTSNPAAQNAILSGMGKEKLFEIVNAVFRNADAGVDLNLEVKPGDDDNLLLEDDQQVMGLLQQLAQAVKKNTDDIAKILPPQPQMQQPAPMGA